MSKGAGIGWRSVVLGAALLGILALAAVEIGSYVFAVRRMQVRAERVAVQAAGATEPLPLRSYVRRVVRLPPGATDPDDRGSVAVEAAKEWASPIFGFRRVIVTQAVAGILPGGGGAGPRIAVLR